MLLSEQSPTKTARPLPFALRQAPVATLTTLTLLPEALRKVHSAVESEQDPRPEEPWTWIRHLPFSPFFGVKVLELPDVLGVVAVGPSEEPPEDPEEPDDPEDPDEEPVVDGPPELAGAEPDLPAFPVPPAEVFPLLSSPLALPSRLPEVVGEGVLVGLAEV